MSAGRTCRDSASENSCAILAKPAGNGCSSFAQSAAESVPCVSTVWKRLLGVPASRCSISLKAMSASRMMAVPWAVDQLQKSSDGLSQGPAQTGWAPFGIGKS